jgi:hypothetical protein
MTSAQIGKHVSLVSVATVATANPDSRSASSVMTSATSYAGSASSRGKLLSPVTNRLSVVWGPNAAKRRPFRSFQASPPRSRGSNFVGCSTGVPATTA